MTDARRQARIEALFADLDGAPPEVREATLAALGDPDLAAEVARLLEAQDRLNVAPAAFLEGLDTTRVQALITPRQGPPDKIGRYPVVRPLGRGGMGEVYLARDPRLDRPVAIKLLPPHLDRDASAVRRLESEARTASALDHPNLATVYEITETEDGRAFIVMAYYDGETLRDRLSRGPLAVDEAIDAAIQLAEGLDAAHRSGVIHRDIKPENVMLTGEGRVVILDFGIAKATGADLVTSGLLRGTAAYMSPEQSRGEATDPRTDLWSTGVVVHELLTGSRPFAGEGSALVHAIREDPPAPLAPGRSGVPPALAELVRQCLAKTPGSRLRSAGELAAALRAIRDGRTPRAPGSRRWLAVLTGVALAALAFIAFLQRGSADRSPTGVVPAATVAAPGIAVLPFEVRSDALDVWREGMVDLLAANLDGVEGLRAIDSRTVLARWTRAMAIEDAGDLAAALAVASDVGARYAVVGSMISNGDALRAAVRVHSVTDGARLASFSVDGPADSLFSLVDRITINVLAAVWQGSERPAAEVNLGRITTRSLPALKSFLNGERLLRHGDYAEAVAEYRDAVIADTGFAFAYYRLGLAQVWIGATEDSAFTWERALREAVRRSAQLPERERFLVRVALAAQVPAPENMRTTLELAQRAVERYPDEPDAWYFLGDIYYHQGDQLRLPPYAADSALQRALSLDPAMAMLYEHMIQNAVDVSFDSARARQLLNSYSKLAAPHRVRRLELAYDFAFGDSASKREALTYFATLTESERVSTIWPLRNLRFGDVLELALGDYDRWETGDSLMAAERLLQQAVDHGDVRRATRLLTARQLLGAHAALHAYRARLGGLSLPDAVSRTALRMPPAGAELPLNAAGFQVAVAGAVAAEEGRWDEHASALARLETMVQLARERSDTATERFINGSRAGLRGYGLGIRGHRRQALSLLVAGQEDATGGESISGDAWNAVMRWWIGDLLEQEGRLSDAARYFGSIRHDAFAAERVAPIHEQLGRPELAREAYLLVAEAWANGDPALKQRAAAARTAAMRLAARTQGD